MKSANSLAAVIVVTLGAALGACATSEDSFWAPQPSGRVTQEQLNQIKVNETTATQVSQLLGAPMRKTKYDRGAPRDAWIYNTRNPAGIPLQVSVQMSPDGVVREMVAIRHPALDKP